MGSSKDSHGSNDQHRYPQREEKEVKEKNPVKKKLAKCTSQAIKKKSQKNGRKHPTEQVAGYSINVRWKV